MWIAVDKYLPENAQVIIFAAIVTYEVIFDYHYFDRMKQSESSPFSCYEFNLLSILFD